MIDIHCHILPNVDDGPSTLPQSIEMAKQAVDQGIHTIIATPHHKNGRYTNNKESILRNIEHLNNKLMEVDIPLTILPGQEPRIYGDLLNDLTSEDILPLNRNTKYVFVELPTSEVPRYTRQLLFDIQMAEYIPIIVHPERNKRIIEHPSILYDFVRTGALTQITAASFVGKLGKNIQKLSHKLIDANLTHFIASDAHNTTTRDFHLYEAYQTLRNEYGSETFYQFMENSQLLIEGKTVIRGQPIYIKKKKILGLF
ncbi:tyrosine-protein phosphatase [Virgibacillus salinus]|uniref:Tyrosine-protein phosphatase n=1 Tax=Virgibacillus salinus TaxID=553311 RepID=A0A1H0YHQ8_9BACI|nr:CpsB/CapC family capsule biosynthesis tyrosine phosphatase [Virgibacillus salinus]SDQ14769.1 protein-tyrosine phosphatase [Virgibacillus salinus]